MGNRFFLKKSEKAQEGDWCHQVNLLPSQTLLIRLLVKEVPKAVIDKICYYQYDLTIY